MRGRRAPRVREDDAAAKPPGPAPPPPPPPPAPGPPAAAAARPPPTCPRPPPPVPARRMRSRSAQGSAVMAGSFLRGAAGGGCRTAPEPTVLSVQGGNLGCFGVVVGGKVAGCFWMNRGAAPGRDPSPNTSRLHSIYSRDPLRWILPG